MNRSGAKKPPSPLVFDIADPVHLEFVVASANMRVGAPVKLLVVCDGPVVVLIMLR